MTNDQNGTITKQDIVQLEWRLTLMKQTLDACNRVFEDPSNPCMLKFDTSKGKLVISIYIEKVQQ